MVDFENQIYIICINCILNVISCLLLVNSTIDNYYLILLVITILIVIYSD